MLADAIVQILPDAALFHFADVQDFLLQSLALRHLHGGAGDAGDPARGIPHRFDRQIIKVFLAVRRQGNFLPQTGSCHQNARLNLRQPVRLLGGKQFGVGLAQHVPAPLDHRFVVNPGITQPGVLVEDHDGRMDQRDAESFLAQTQGFFRRGQFPLLLNLRQHARGDRGQDLQKPGAFDQVIPSAAFHHLDGHPFVALSGDNQEGGQTVEEGELTDDLPGIEILKFQIQQKQIQRVVFQPGNGIRAGGGGGDGKTLPFQRPGRQAQQAAIVIDDQERGGWFAIAHAPVMCGLRALAPVQ